MKNKMKFLSDCELRMMFLFWSVNSPASRMVVENELAGLGWDPGLISSSLDALTEKGLISRHWLGHGDARKEFYMAQVGECDYWRNTGCTQAKQPRRSAPARRPCTILWI